MSKTQEAETKEQMNRVQATLETVVQRSVRKADNHNCKAAAETFLTFAVSISAARVIDVEFVKQVVNSLSAVHSEPKTLDTGGARTIHIDYLERNCIERCMMKLENDDRGGLGWRAVACVFGHWSDHWGGPDCGPQLDDGCCFARHSRSGTAELCVCCIRSAPANWKCTRDKRTRGCVTAKRHDFEKHANQDHQPHEREDVESLMVFWRSAVAADGVECTVWSRYTGTVLAARC